MRTVHEVSKLTGVSVRTLHHYDAMDLLKPTQTTQAGYRLYDDHAMNRLTQILLFRELQMPLKEIKAILDHPNFDPAAALEQQIHLLELQKKQITELIALARRIQKGEIEIMHFDVFKKTEIDQYKEEVREKWGLTTAYQEYEKKAKTKTGQEFAASANQLMALFAEIGSLREFGADAKEVQEKIGQLQEQISQNYYHCTDELLYDLGQMYCADERFSQNIDQAGGKGTAEFVRQAISSYVQNASASMNQI